MKNYDYCIAHKTISKIQTVREHCLSVANYAAGNGKTLGLEKTMFLIGALHDLGKFSDEFQRRISGEELDHVDHSSMGGKVIYDKFHISDNSVRNLASEIMCLAISEHHGQVDIIDNGECTIKKRHNNLPEVDVDEAIAVLNVDIDALFNDAVKEINEYYLMIIDLANNVVPVKKARKDMVLWSEAYFFYAGLLKRLCLSMLTDADWRDTYEFYNRKETRFEDSLRKPAFEKGLENLMDYRKTLPYNVLSESRNELAEMCRDHVKYGNGIYKCTMPTGAGKTLDSTEYALRLAIETNKRHIYYNAPFLSITEQNADNIRKFTKFTDELLEYHSNIVRDTEDEFGNRIPNDVFDTPYIATTMVRLLTIMFSNSKADIRRFWQLASSVIVIDEAQSIPQECLNLFNQACNFLTYCCNTTVLLCTATQPLLEKTKRPILLSDHYEMVNDVKKYNDIFKRTEIVDATRNGGYNADELCDFVFTNTVSNCLIILNTKGAVRTLYKRIKERGKLYKVFELTTYMCAQHRSDVINEMKTLLKEGKRVICVSTQLIEAGVDISFETVIRSVAGIDSIIQASGRNNREKEYSYSKTFIVNPNLEMTKYLRQIQTAQTTFEEMILNKYSELLSEEAINAYYEALYRQTMENMDFENMFSRLSLNATKRHTTDAKYFTLKQDFKSVGDEFKVIDDTYNVSIIVPYESDTTSGKEIIEQIKASDDVDEIRHILRKAQRFTVSLNTNSGAVAELLSKFCAVKTIDNSEIFLLNNNCYDECGVVL